MMQRVNDKYDPNRDIDDVKERDTIFTKAIASGPPTRTR